MNEMRECGAAPAESELCISINHSHLMKNFPDFPVPYCKIPIMMLGCNLNTGSPAIRMLGLPGMRFHMPHASSQAQGTGCL